MNSSNILRTETFQTRKRHQERKLRIKEKSNEIPKSYKYDINNFIQYCIQTDQQENVHALLDYLYISLTEEKVKKNTWERRLAAVKKYLTVKYDIDFRLETEMANELSMMRKMYQEEEYADLTRIEGKSGVNKNELIEMIRNLDVRGKAICFTQLITASRPSEMVQIKIRHFNLENNSLSLYLKKQKTWHEKRLTQEATRAVKHYISHYKLKPDDYFVGRLNRNGEYMSVQASDSGYRYMLNKWIGLTGYNLRKTQVTAMHELGADLPTIAKQTGHKSMEVLSKHYLNVSDSTIDKYL